MDKKEKAGCFGLHLEMIAAVTLISNYWFRSIWIAGIAMTVLLIGLFLQAYEDDYN
jgi:hypothetical protein